jgi:hypothetical protein
VNLTRRPDRGRPPRDGPGAGFGWSGGEKAHQIEHIIGVPDKAVAGRLLQSQVGQKQIAFVFLKLGNLHLHLAADRNDAQTVFFGVRGDVRREGILQLALLSIVDH